MPIMDVEMVVDRGAEPRPGLAADLADRAAAVFGTPAGRTWVRLRLLPLERYAENGGGPPEGVLPVFVSVLEARMPEGDALAARVKGLTAAVAEACERPADNVHVLYLPPGAGRIAFGGTLVPD